MMTDATGPAAVGAHAQLARLARAVGEGVEGVVGSDGSDSGGPFARLRPPLSSRGRPAAVLILFGPLTAALPPGHGDLDVLLVERAATLRAHAGQIAFPGGRIDPGDDGPVAAALREAQEETGLDPSGVEVLGDLGVVPLERSRHLVTPVLGWWRKPSPVRVVDDAECASVFRVPVAELLDARNRGSTVIRHAHREWRGPAFVAHSGGREHLVWGFTAMLLDALFDELGWAGPWDTGREFPLVGAPAPHGDANED